MTRYCAAARTSLNKRAKATLEQIMLKPSLKQLKRGNGERGNGENEENEVSPSLS